MGFSTRVCSLAGMVALAALSWTTAIWVISPFVAEAVSLLDQAYGYVP